MTRIRPGSTLREVSDTRESLETAPWNRCYGKLESNPFATRFTQPGALPYLICSDPPFDKAGPSDPEPEPFRSPARAGVTGERSAGWHDGAMEQNGVLEQDGALEQLVHGLVRDRIGLIVGPHGTGKSTLLHTLIPLLRQQFERVDLVRLHGASGMGVLSRWRHAGRVGRQAISASSRAGEGALLVVDGIEQLNRWHRRRLRWSCRRRGQAVLATSHRPLPGMRVLYTTRIDASMIHELVGRLLGPASAEVAALVRAEIERRDLDRVANLRDLWFELYDVVQPMLIATPLHDTSNILHGRTLVRPHDPVASPDREGGADC